MLKLFVVVQVWLLHRSLARTDSRTDGRTDRGSVTTEHVLWAVAVIAIAGIVVAAIKAFVTTQAGNIK